MAMRIASGAAFVASYRFAANERDINTAFNVGVAFAVPFLGNAVYDAVVRSGREGKCDVFINYG